MQIVIFITNNIVICMLITNNVIIDLIWKFDLTNEYYHVII